MVKDPSKEREQLLIAKATGSFKRSNEKVHKPNTAKFLFARAN